MNDVPREAKREYAHARRLASAALRAGCTSFEAIVRYCERRSPDLHPLSVFGALLVMERLGDVAVIRDRKYKGISTMTMPWPSRRRETSQDLLDVADAREALAEAEREGTVSWKRIKTEERLNGQD